MKQSAFSKNAARGLHVAIIMDGNGRWAQRRGWPRVIGHRAGAKNLRTIVKIAPSFGVGTLTLYAFSSDNWKRPQNEISALFQLFARYLRSETAACVKNGVRLNAIGRRDRLPPDLRALIEGAEEKTSAGDALHVRIAVDYSARDAIVAAVGRLAGNFAVTRERFSAALAQAMHAPDGAPDVDLVIRTGGEQRLSDFLLWECAYSELHFTPKMWPEFSPEDFAQAMAFFHGRERRFGGVPEFSSVNASAR
jgi:undecaprenyl diphosphate synthase